MRKTLEDRFLEKVDMSGGPDACWPWIGGTVGKGYGTIYVYGKKVPVSQVAWSLYHGRPFPEGKYGCHHCDNPPCANPRHIFPGTQQENLDDMAAKGRKPFGEKKARRGSSNGRTVFDAVVVSAIRVDRAAGMTLQELEDKYGVSKTHASRISRGEGRNG